MATTQQKERSLRPKEHGAYGQLALPLVTALATGRPGAASACLICASIALFVAHEPLLVLSGWRGAWAKSQSGRRARRAALGWIGVALASGVGGLWLGDEAVLVAALLPIALVLALAAIVRRGAEKTLAGEILAALTLAAAALPVAVAGGLALEEAVMVWGVWAVAFSVSTAAVHRVISAHKGRPAHASLVVATTISVAALLLAKHWPLLLSSLPMLLLSWALIARPPDARRLKRIGWTLMISGVLSAALTVASVRTGQLNW